MNAALNGASARFEACLNATLQVEGGFSDHPADPGGATMLGITQATLAAHRGRPVTVAEVRALTLEEARQIYRARYWRPVAGDQLPPGLDLMVFDFGVNAGPARAARLLQRIAGAAQDGVIGPRTLAAVRALRPAAAIDAYAVRRLEYHRGLDTWPHFGRGWTARIRTIHRAAQAMAAEVWAVGEV